jgi:hypothetical protein
LGAQIEFVNMTEMMHKKYILTGVIEIGDKWPQLLCTATNIFLVVSMI